MPDKPPIHLATDRDPWDRQPGESQRQYSRFRSYLELGRTRSLKQTHETLTALGDQLTQRTVYQLSHVYRWGERAQAFDTDQDRLHREKLFTARQDMIERHQKIARGLQSKALQRLQQLAAADLTPLDVVRMLRLSALIEHKAIGEPDQRVAVTGADGGPLMVDDLSQYPPKERRRRLEELAGELARRAGGIVTGGDELDIED